MATNTYVALSTQVLTGTVSSVTFSSIPSEYTDLVLVVKDVAAGGGGYTVGLRFNGETSSSTKYSGTYMTGSGSVTATGRGANMTFIDAGYTGGTDATRIIHLMNYSNSSLNKTILSQSFSVSGSQIASYASMWRDTTPINAIYIYSESGNTYSAGSTFTLYGISDAGNTGTKAIGGDVYTDSTYVYHAFPMSGKFTPTQNVTADILVIAGGGGGGLSAGASGGGGAGGVLGFASQSLTSGTNYQVLIGGGGAKGAVDGAQGTSGSNSQFGSLTPASVGGGGGGGYGVALTGGSGGGGGYFNGTNNGAGYPGATGTSGQGNAGGQGWASSGNHAAGGGGGAGAAGAAATTGVPGAGGAGANSVTNFSNLGTALTVTGFGVSGYIAGGGGGGAYNAVAAGGTGGGGAGARSYNVTAAISGTANTGSGGGGGASNNTDGSAGSGGSGLVIVRYAK